MQAPREAARRFDAIVDDGLDHLRGRPWFDRAMYGATALGDGGRIWFALSVASSLGAPGPRRRLAHTLVWLGVESALVNGPAKALVRRPRPIHHRGHPHSLRQPTDSSFPSGHAASAAIMAVLLSRGPIWSAAVWPLGVAIAVSRVHVGVHHASDVAAGFAIGVGLGVVARVTETN